MSSSRTQPPTNGEPAIDDEVLVAYLDGELPAEQQDAVLQRLSHDGQLRKRVAELQASWDMLDELPKQPLQPDLAQSTMEMVTLAIEKETGGWRSWLSGNRWLALTIGALVMLIAGATTARAINHFQTRQMLADLPAIVDNPSLKYIDSVEFLERLVGLRVKLDEVAEDRAGRHVIGDGRVPIDFDERRAWVENLDSDGRGKLESNLRDMGLLSPQRKEVVRQICQRIYENSERTAEYLQTIRAYEVFLDRLGSKPISELEEEPIEERIRDISAWISKLVALNYVPSADDREKFRMWLNEIMEREENMNYFYSEMHIVRELLYGDPDNPILVTDDDVTTLIKSLNVSTAKKLNDIKDPYARRSTLGKWIDTSVLLTELPATREEDLEQSYQALPKDDKNAYDFLPEEEVHRRLRESLNNPNQVGSSILPL